MTVTNFVWDELSDNVLMEVDDVGNVTAEYSNEPDQFGELISQRRNQKDSYYHFDAQHSTRQLTTESQEESDSYTYSAFGETVATSGSTMNPFGYNGSVGYYTDAGTGAIYVRRRSYDPLRGRWLSADPLAHKEGMNRFTYSWNNPVVAFDPSGQITITLKDKIWPRKCGQNHWVAHKIKADKHHKAEDGRCYWVLHIKLRCTRVGCRESESGNSCCDWWWPNIQFDSVEYLEAAEMLYADPKGKTIAPAEHEFDFAPRRATCGRYIGTATAKLFCESKQNELKDIIEKWDEGLFVPFCGKRVRTGEYTLYPLNNANFPKFWSNMPEAEDSSTLSFRITWVCCWPTRVVIPTTKPDR